MNDSIIVGILSACVCACVVLAGCAAPSTEEVATTSAADEWLDAARAEGASDEQVAILEDGEVTFDEYQAAVDRTMECLRDSGIDVVGGNVSESRGFPEIGYSYSGSSSGRSDDQTLEIADECIPTHSMFVEAAYQNSPAAIEAQESGFAPYRDATVACLREQGSEIADDATMSEILIESSDVAAETGIDCPGEAGYYG